VKTLARDRDTAELLDRLKRVRPDAAGCWGRMSAHQMVCHLADNFRMALGMKLVLPTTGLLQRTLVKWLALYAPLQWPPGRLRTSPEVDQEQGGTRPTVFDADLAESEALLKRVAAEAGSLHRHRHPVFGPMSDGDWLRWAYLHTDHHLRQFGL
jgi:DinB superfamily